MGFFYGKSRGVNNRDRNLDGWAWLLAGAACRRQLFRSTSNPEWPNRWLRAQTDPLSNGKTIGVQEKAQEGAGGHGRADRRTGAVGARAVTRTGNAPRAIWAWCAVDGCCWFGEVGFGMGY